MTTKTTTIIDYPEYSVDTEGTVYNKYGKILKPQNYKGYDSVYLYKNKKRRKLRVQRIVAHTFLGLDLNDTKAQVHHKDSNRINNSLENLEVCTNRHNARQIERTNNYQGVTKRVNGTYKAQIWIDGKNINLGTFKTEYEAHLEYVKKDTEYMESILINN